MSVTRPLSALTLILAGAGAAGEQTAGHGGGESVDADQQQLDSPASCQRLLQGTQALTWVLPSSSE